MESRSAATMFATLYLLLAATMGAQAATTDSMLMRWLFGVLSFGLLGLSTAYWLAVRNLP